MISIDMCQLYGIGSEKELITAIDGLRKMGMSDIAIQVILDRSKVGTMTEEEAKARWICCPLCDNKKCVRGTGKCEAEIWARKRMKEESEGKA